MAISAGFLSDGCVNVRVGDAYRLMTQAEWGDLPLWSGTLPFPVTH